MERGPSKVDSLSEEAQALISGYGVTENEAYWDDYSCFGCYSTARTHNKGVWPVTA
jgi:hypothetical protein